jgi:two-component system response regulator HupR/HoxA
MSPAMQTSLLRVLQEGEIKPLGSNRTKKVDIRVISATNKNLENEVKEGRFREDLFYRLSVFAINIPPLRERIADIPVLADYFLRKFNKKSNSSIKGLSRKAMERLTTYAFPGNVRELENEIERAMAMAENGKPIKVNNLSEKIYKGPLADNTGFKLQGTLKETVEALEISVLSQTLEKHHSNKTRTASELGLSRYGLSKKMQRYGL